MPARNPLAVVRSQVSIQHRYQQPLPRVLLNALLNALLSAPPLNHQGARQVISDLQAIPDLLHQVHLPSVVVNPTTTAPQLVETKIRKHHSEPTK